MANIWRLFSGEWCPYCDNVILIKTESGLENGYGYPGDMVACPKCKANGKFVLDKNINHVKWEPDPRPFHKRVPSEVYVCLVFILLLITFGYTSYFFFKV